MNIINHEDLTPKEREIKKIANSFGDQLVERFGKYFYEFDLLRKLDPKFKDITEQERYLFITHLINPVIEIALHSMKDISVMYKSGNTMSSLFEELVSGWRALINNHEKQYAKTEIKSIDKQGY